MLKFSHLILVLAMGSLNAYANDLNLKYAAGSKSSDINVMEKALERVSELLPLKLKNNLPQNIELKIEALSAHKTIPDETCSEQLTAETASNKKAQKPFIYGSYNQYNNVLTIHSAILSELAKGSEKSTRINCQHKSLYDQAIATIIHELTHAYDLKNGRISNNIEYINRAGFKKGLLKIKTKNVKAMRSADAYELVNIAESFAVNMEYFTMDAEFMCRKPSMFDFFKKHFEVDPFPGRNCRMNNTVMMSTMTGFQPVQLDASRVYRIDYLLASAGKDIMSGFGHSMFRIIICAPERLDAMTGRVIPATPFGKKCLEDKLFHLVISYRANVEDAKLSYVKGLTGGYPSMLFILPFSDVLNEYNRDELRDVISYPLILSTKEREEFITRVKEEHWNYRGSYKFINNNCAVESYDLLKSALGQAGEAKGDLNQKSSLTPNGVLEDLDRLQYLSSAGNETEIFKSNTDSIILAYQKAYGFKLSKNAASNKSAVQKFIEKSTKAERMKKFREFMSTKSSNGDLNAELVELKENMIIASSFSIMEQQIIGTKALGYRKKAAEMAMDLENAEVQELVKEAQATFTNQFKSLSTDGYGIPLSNEVMSKEDLEQKKLASKETMDKSEDFLRRTMPAEIADLEEMRQNIEVFNKGSLSIRREYREKLNIYIIQVIRNMTRNDHTRSIMVNAVNGDAGSLKKVRELMGSDLVDDKTILDSKLRKMIEDSL